MPRTLKNRYVSRAKITEAKFRGFVRCFALDLEATKIAALTGLNRNTVNRLTRLLRLRIAERGIVFAAGPWLTHGGLPVGIRYPFAPGSLRSPFTYRVLLNQRQEVALFPEAARFAAGHDAQRPPAHCETPDPVTAVGIAPPADWCDLTTLRPPIPIALIGARKTIEAFWLSARMRLVKFRGIPPGSLPLHLHECEFRFNHRGNDLEAMLMEMVRLRALL
jgi:transposase